MIEYIKLSLENKDFLTAIIVIWILVVIIMPLVYFIIKILEKNLIKAIKDLWITFESAFNTLDQQEVIFQGNLTDRIIEHDRDSKRQFLELQQKMWNTVLNTAQTVDLLQAKMWFVSYWKLEFLKQVMTLNHIAWRREEITKKVKEELARRSDDYLKDFKSYITPIWDLSKWLDFNFNEKDFSKFVEQIVDIIYSDKLQNLNPHMTKELIITIKVNEISTLMKEVQAWLGKKLKKDIEEYLI